MLGFMKRLAARLPASWRHELQRLHYARQLRRGRFATHEPEFHKLSDWIRPGDWALDIGANVGHYTSRLSQLAGPNGRVLAFEPVPATFRLLAANTRLFQHPNVTLFNAAASDAATLTGIEVPDGSTGPYLAHLLPNAALKVLCICVDQLDLPQPVRLVKIDAEGHELSVLRGMKELIDRDHPTLIVEVSNVETQQFLVGAGYSVERFPGSPNCVFRAVATSQPVQR
jgi:FkbM family methyltransferase